MVREMGLEPTRLWLDTGTSSLPVYLFQHSRICDALWTLGYYISEKEKSQAFFEIFLLHGAAAFSCFKKQRKRSRTDVGTGDRLIADRQNVLGRMIAPQ